MAQLAALAIAPSSRRTYSTSETRYLDFCRTYNCQALPGSDHVLAYYAAFLTRTLQPASVRTYMSGIRNLHLELGFSYPDDSQTPLLSRVMRGVARSSSSPRCRLPITVPLLRELCRRLDISQLRPRQDRLMLKAAFTLAFHGFMRCGELTSGLTRAHLMLDPAARYLQIHLDRSKTDPTGKGESVTVGASQDELICPVKAMLAYLSTRHRASKCLFNYSNGVELTRERVTQELRNLLPASGVSNAASYSSHSPNWCSNVCRHGRSARTPDTAHGPLA